MNIFDGLKIGLYDECWNWSRSVDTRGYGNLKIDGRTVRAHRAAYEYFYGAIPKGSGHHGTVVMHTCDNRLCCNTWHLKLGTQQDNIADMKAKGRRKNIGQGESNGRAVLSLDAVLSIRQDRRSQRVIAYDYHVSKAAVQRIKAGRAWASA